MQIELTYLQNKQIIEESIKQSKFKMINDEAHNSQAMAFATIINIQWVYHVPIFTACSHQNCCSNRVINR